MNFWDHNTCCTELHLVHGLDTVDLSQLPNLFQANQKLMCIINASQTLAGMVHQSTLQEAVLVFDHVHGDIFLNVRCEPLLVHILIYIHIPMYTYSSSLIPPCILVLVLISSAQSKK